MKKLILILFISILLGGLTGCVGPGYYDGAYGGYPYAGYYDPYFYDPFFYQPPLIIHQHHGAVGSHRHGGGHHRHHPGIHDTGKNRHYRSGHDRQIVRGSPGRTHQRPTLGGTAPRHRDSGRRGVHQFRSGAGRQLADDRQLHQRQGRPSAGNRLRCSGPRC